MTTNHTLSVSSTAFSHYSLYFPVELDAEQVVTWLHALSGLLPGVLGRLRGCPAITLELRASAPAGFGYSVCVRREQASYVTGQLQTAVPGIRIESVEPGSDPEWTQVVDVGMRRGERSLRVEPAALSGSLLASLRGFSLRAHEVIVLRLLIRPAVPVKPPASSAKPRPVRLGPFMKLSPKGTHKDALLDMRAKLQAVNFLASVRIGVYARDEARAKHLLADIRAAFRSVSTASNGLYTRAMPQGRLRRSLITNREPFLYPLQLTADELAGLLAWPIGGPFVAGLPVSRSRLLPPSGAIAGRGLVVASATFPGAERRLALTTGGICQHLHVAGPTGSGKTALLGNLAAQAMKAGLGIIVIEAKGDLFKLVLNSVPRERLDDVVLLDVGDDRPVGFNLLEQSGSPRQAVEELCQLFEYLYPDMRRGVWARAALHRGLSTLATRPGMTFTDLVPLLAPSSHSRLEQQWRDELVGGLSDPELTRFWERFDALSPAQQVQYAGPVLDRVWQLNERPEIRAVIGQSTSSFQMSEAIRQRRVVLINLGRVSPESARLIGSLLLSAIWNAVRSGAADPNRPTLLLLDEFQDFLNLPVDPETLLVRARSFGLGMVLAHQHLDQLPSGIRAAVLANARSKVVFESTADDARVWSREFGRTLSDDDFIGLGQFEVLCRLMTVEGVSPPVSGVTLGPPTPTDSAQRARESSRARYGRDVADIEVEILKRRTPLTEPAPRKRPRLGGLTWE